MESHIHSKKGIRLKANGKLLLTGEYLVMDGAAALALPIIYGQTLTADENQSDILTWTASDVNGIWFQAELKPGSFDVISSTDNDIAENLRKLLENAAALNTLHSLRKGITVSTHLNFDRLYGLGSSSTLISLVAGLFEADKYKLHKKVSGGSGYDVACSGFNHPIIYKKQSDEKSSVVPLNFNPPFSEQIFFVYLGYKQDTNKEISKYLSIDKKNINNEITDISEITFKIAEVKDLTTFASLIDLHEEITGRVLGRKGIKESRFSNFEGSIKSLGAWGGDFLLAATPAGEAYVKNYFAQFNINVVLNFKNLILNEPVISGNEVIIRF